LWVDSFVEEVILQIQTNWHKKSATSCDALTGFQKFV
jgi:hypothetical protein